MLLELLTLNAIASLFTLTILEIVLGIDNLVFLSILTNKLPEAKRALARKLGLIFAMLTRLLLLFLVNVITQSNIYLFELFNVEVTVHSLVLGLGGLFLFYKAVTEIHEDIEGGGASKQYLSDSSNNISKLNLTKYISAFWLIIMQVMILDIIFSLDSVITAVGMTHNYTIMSIAIIISVLLMLFASGPLSKFIYEHPTVKMLALSFLILIGTMLMAQSIGYDVDKGYLYFAIAFSLLVEFLNIRAARKRKLRESK